MPKAIAQAGIKVEYAATEEINLQDINRLLDEFLQELLTRFESAESDFDHDDAAQITFRFRRADFQVAVQYLETAKISLEDNGVTVLRIWFGRIECKDWTDLGKTEEFPDGAWHFGTDDPLRTPGDLYAVRRPAPSEKWDVVRYYSRQHNVSKHIAEFDHLETAMKYVESIAR